MSAHHNRDGRGRGARSRGREAVEVGTGQSRHHRGFDMYWLRLTVCSGGRPNGDAVGFLSRRSWRDGLFDMEPMANDRV